MSLYCCKGAEQPPLYYIRTWQGDVCGTADLVMMMLTVFVEVGMQLGDDHLRDVDCQEFLLSNKNMVSSTRLAVK